MRGWIVHWQSARLCKRDDEEGCKRQKVTRIEQQQRIGHRTADHLPQPSTSGAKSDGEDRNHDGWFSQCRNRHLSAGTHATKRAARIQSGKREKKRAEKKHVHQQNDVAYRLQRACSCEHGNNERRDQHRSENNVRCKSKNPGGVLRNDRFLDQKLPEVPIRLPNSGSAPALQSCLRLPDYADEHWRTDDDNQPLNKRYGKFDQHFPRTAERCTDISQGHAFLRTPGISKQNRSGTMKGGGGFLGHFQSAMHG